MNDKSVHRERGGGGAYVRLPVPLGDPDAFSHRATADVLQLLVDNPERSFTNRELHRTTGRGLGGVNAAVDALEGLGVIDVSRHGRANAVRIDPDMVVTPSDPVLSIPQPEYQDPTRWLLDRIEAEIGREVGVVLFGSVATGDADRASDIDLFVVVASGRMRAQRAAHSIEQDIFEETFDGDRYEAHVVVETVETAVDHARIRDVLADALTLRTSPLLESVKQEVFGDGA